MSLLGILLSPSPDVHRGTRVADKCAKSPVLVVVSFSLFMFCVYAVYLKSGPHAAHTAL